MNQKPSLNETLFAQIARVDQRVKGSGAYLQEADEIRQAAKQVPMLRKTLGLGNFHRSLTPMTGKPQFLLAFESSRHLEPAVLKVYGRRRPGEGAIQHLWTGHGVRCAVTLEHGDDPTSWLLMKVINGQDLTTEITGVTDIEAICNATEDVACVMAPAHAVPLVGLAGAQPLGDGVIPHLRVVVDALTRHGYDSPKEWAWVSETIYRFGESTFLHGDLFPGNLMRDVNDGGLRMIDSCAYIGDRSFDAARWTVRVSTPETYTNVLASWLVREPDIDRVALTGMLAVESLMQAGVREIVKDEQGLPSEKRDRLTEAYTAAAAHLFDLWSSRRSITF